MTNEDGGPYNSDVFIVDVEEEMTIRYNKENLDQSHIGQYAIKVTAWYEHAP